jgi:hypothetical protein
MKGILAFVDVESQNAVVKNRHLPMRRADFEALSWLKSVGDMIEPKQPSLVSVFTFDWLVS